MDSTDKLSPLSDAGVNFYMNDLFATSSLEGLIDSSLDNQFITKNGAIQTAQLIVNVSEEIENWRNITTPLPDTGEGYQQIQELVALTAGFLVDLSFSLKQERTITLDRDRTLLDLLAELFGEIDDELDFFITSNELTGSEILTLPKGKKLVYYI